MKTFKVGGQNVAAADRVGGFLVDPVMPEDFDATDNEKRPTSHAVWWDVPFIVSYRDTGAEFLKAWPTGVRYDVRCLDGGAWDRSTWWGSFATMDECVTCAKAGPQWRKSTPAVLLGGRGGAAGTGKAKARTSAQASAAAAIRWGKTKHSK